MKRIFLCLSLLFLVACTDYEAKFEDVYGPLASSWEEQEMLLNYINSQSLDDGQPLEDGQTISDIECLEGVEVELSDEFFDYNFRCNLGHWVLMSSTQKNVPFDNSTTVASSSSKKISSSSKMVSSSSRKISSSSRKVASSSSKAKSTTSGSCAKAMYCAEAKMDDLSFFGQVATGFDDGSDTYGYWYSYTDESEGGDSYFTWPAGLDEFDGFEMNSRNTYGAIKGSFTLGRIMDYGYGGLAFSIGGEEMLGYDISAWGGLCVTYTATSSMALEIKVFNEEIVTGYNNPTALLTPSSSIRTVDFVWEDFEQEYWLNSTPKVSTSRVVSDAAAIAFKLQSSNSFAIYAIGKIGTCN